MIFAVPAALAALAVLTHHKGPAAGLRATMPKSPTRPLALAALATITPAVDAATHAARCPNLFPMGVAQAMLETGWGKAIPGRNWSGIKGKGPAGATNVPTREEFKPGEVTHIRANFRAYNTAQESVADWLHFVTGGRYAPALQMSPTSAALWIWAQGYATASRYVPGLVSVSRRAAAATGLPHLELKPTAEQTELAATLGALAPGARRAAALRLYNAQRWPA